MQFSGLAQLAGSVGAVLALGGTMTAVQADTYKGLEIPAYSVLKRDGPIELRQYPPHIVAEVTVKGSKNGAANRGFRLLAGYIFGDNSSAEKMAMTAPVTQSETIAMTAPVTQSGDGNIWTIRFVMPRKYTMDTLPKPENSAVRLIETEPTMRLAVTFSGRGITRDTTSFQKQLDSYAKANNLELTSGYESAYYDDPFTAPWNRRNELSVEVK